ncbi:unnamed protein product [Trichogramma brassicae]|uniref:Uncharacterized protein n=1 Tax=Trichogramma brassicae TaxID=86971 RepID=A0A6H5ITG6_9HYME|nr:unnamed protein product [Trichogramma brassicae]
MWVTHKPAIQLCCQIDGACVSHPPPTAVTSRECTSTTTTTTSTSASRPGNTEEEEGYVGSTTRAAAAAAATNSCVFFFTAFRRGVFFFMVSKEVCFFSVWVGNLGVGATAPLAPVQATSMHIHMDTHLSLITSKSAERRLPGPGRTRCMYPSLSRNKERERNIFFNK